MSTRKGAWQHPQTEFLRQNVTASSMFINHKPRKHFVFDTLFGACIWSGLSVRSVVKGFGA